MTTAKALTLAILEAFIGGQFKAKSPRHTTVRGEISGIDQPCTKVRITLLWSAIKHGSNWFDDHMHTYFLYLPKCQYRMDIGGVLRVDCPYLGLAMTFYPKGHKKNICRQDVKPKPQLAKA